MVEEAEAERCVREEVALHVVLLNRVIDVVGQAHILGGRATALVLISGNVGAKVESAKTISSYCFLSSATLRHLNADVVALRTLLAQKTDAAPVEIVGTAGRCRGAAITPNGGTC